MINGIKPKPMVRDFDSAIDRLIENIHKDYEKWINHLRPKKTIILKNGRKFVKIIHDNSVWGFVVKEDGSHKGLPTKAGDVLKAAGWSAPAKHTRGNIFDDNTDYFTWTGPNYR
jgi:hypothetical protein|tara:strand:- start:1994 stop:2335 length:342 start_codon:yes stop_codon:yes gene_type:complete